ncbi:hypothetical protein [Azospirillum argentinense]
MVKQRLSRCANQSNRPAELARPFVQSNSQDLPLCHTRCAKNGSHPRGAPDAGNRCEAPLEGVRWRPCQPL